jgi:AraC family transcriptional regulator
MAGVARKEIGQGDHFRASIIRDERQVVEFVGSPNVGISIHIGSAVDLACRRGGETHRGKAIHGDVEIIPPGVPGVWELTGPDTELVLCLGVPLLHAVVEEYGGDPSRLSIRNRFHGRDPRIEHIGWALMEELESGSPSGLLYLDSIATALATTIVRRHSSLAIATDIANGVLHPSVLRQVLEFIEENLHRDVRLHELATVSRLGISRFKSLFRATVGVSAYQYLIRRRVERAAGLLRNGSMSISRVALESGFCHQSHLALQMKRHLGVTPTQVQRTVSRPELERGRKGQHQSHTHE